MVIPKLWGLHHMFQRLSPLGARFAWINLGSDFQEKWLRYWSASFIAGSAEFEAN